MGVQLDSQQLEAIDNLKNGNILVGDTGTGKSRTALAYYYMNVCRGTLNINGNGRTTNMRKPRDLYIITTAKKRDSLEWDEELSHFILFRGTNKQQHVNIVIDSWNNIKKYRKIFGAMFIFDEQRLTGKGVWVKSFWDIARKNQWILLTATPGDTWTDFMPVFVANGFYKNKTEFERTHCVYARYSKYPKIESYIHKGILLKHRNDIVITMEIDRHTVPHDIDILCDYDKALYRTVWKDRLNPYTDEPIEETGELFYQLRHVVNSDVSRLEAVERILKDHDRAVIFYNFTFELHALRELANNLGIDIGEWNGEVHSEVPKSNRWVYLVQYIAGCEGWNCTATDTMIFFSRCYSYKQTKQARGRIDRRNTPYTHLYYYTLKSRSPIDIAIGRALSQKKDFNNSMMLKRR